MNLNPVKLTYYIIFFLTFVSVSCRQTKHVPPGKHLLKKNKVIVEGDKMDEDALAEIIRQQPNRRALGLKMRLWAYNRDRYFFVIPADSATIAAKRARQNNKLKEKNRKRKEKQDRINNARIIRARENGDEYYTEKIIPLKDTLEPRMFFREWFKYKIGEPPVIVDTSYTNRSVDQLGAYLKKKGYYYGNVRVETDTNARNTKITNRYIVETGKPYIIDSIYVKCENPAVAAAYKKYTKDSGNPKLKGEKFDSDLLDAHRNSVAKFMRDEKLYGFSPSHINFKADTFKLGGMKVILGVEFTNRLQKSPYYKDSLIEIRHQVTSVRDVYFHIVDTTYFKGNFRATVESRGLQLMENNFMITLDSLEYAEVMMTRKQKRDKGIPIAIDTLNPNRMATFKFNTKPVARPDIIELQNYLEETNYYKEYYLERSYTRLLQLGLFQTIKPVIIEIPGTDKIDVHYYLVPAKKQGYSFEPRFTNSNGFLGVAASVSYNNKNLFRGSERLTISFSGGFESQPPIFDETLDGEKIQKAGRSFNTFEIGPTVKLDLPGLFPLKVTQLSKRHRPRTIISTAYNYQKRVDFDRGVFQLNYTYKFFSGKTQVIQFGLPFASVIKFVAINKSSFFEQKLTETNDLFLRNAYSDQFIWQDFKISYEYNNKAADKKGRATFFFNTTFDHAGLFTNWVSKKDTNANGQRQIFGVGYSQFARLDNEFIVGYPLDKKKSLHFRFVAGGGLPYGNTKTSLPYDYSFFAGGANDNRGWRARSLGPGGYKYYLDPNRTATQIGDLRLGGSAEFRFAITKLLKSAFFMDAANIWTTKEDVNRPGGKFSSDWYKQIALSSGVGLRLDFGFFVVRVDLGIPITNPALPAGAKWIFQSRQKYYDEGEAVFGSNYKNLMPKPFTPTLNFGIGYPF